MNLNNRQTTYSREMYFTIQRLALYYLHIKKIEQGDPKRFTCDGEGKVVQRSARRWEPGKRWYGSVAPAAADVVRDLCSQQHHLSQWVEQWAEQRAGIAAAAAAVEGLVVALSCDCVRWDEERGRSQPPFL